MLCEMKMYFLLFCVCAYWMPMPIERSSNERTNERAMRETWTLLFCILQFSLSNKLIWTTTSFFSLFIAMYVDKYELEYLYLSPQSKKYLVCIFEYVCCSSSSTKNSMIFLLYIFSSTVFHLTKYNVLWMLFYFLFSS